MSVVFKRHLRHSIRCLLRVRNDTLLTLRFSRVSILLCRIAIGIGNAVTIDILLILNIGLLSLVLTICYIENADISVSLLALDAIGE